MTIFGEPISLWLSIAAIIISIISLIVTRCKQKFDERTVIAQYIEKIKTTYGEGVKHSGNILTKLDNLEKDYAKDKTEDIGLIHEIRSIMTDTKAMYEDIYNKLGHQDIKISDPVSMAAITVDSRTTINKLELMKGLIEKMESRKEK
jgi:hypothetical protein